MTAALRIGIAKPDYGIVGGFELVLRRIEEALRRSGHIVEWLTVEVSALPRRAFDVAVPDHVWDADNEVFRYFALVEAFARLDASRVDVVLSTQPPSFAVDHPRHLSLFYHHLRRYYDLADVHLAAGLGGDPEVFEAARSHVRRIDNRFLQQPQWFLTPSPTVQDRLETFNGITGKTSAFHAGVPFEEGFASEAEGAFDYPLCVSRHEFPKRTELFVHALKLLPEATGVVVGGGGRLAFVRSLDARLSRLSATALEALDEREVWLCRHDVAELEPPDEHSNVRFLGRVDDDHLRSLYAGALCVVAPAYLEDYGLTAVEAMRHGKPVIVCKDGGGLVDFIDDGVTGFVVEPTGPAVAEAVATLRGDPERARRMGEAARTASREFTWERAAKQLETGLLRVTS